MKIPMKIVILDGLTANPGDLTWKRLEQLGNLTVYERSSEDDVIERCKDAEIVFTNKTPLKADMLNKLPKLRFIGVLATGYNIVDIKSASALGITVCNVPAYSTMSVAQNVFALILEITNDVATYSKEIRQGKWSQCKDFSYTNSPIMELAGKKMGIVGLGAIGKRVATIAMAMGMEVIAFTSQSPSEIAPIKSVDLDTLFKECDILSLHCPLTENTYRLVNKDILALMKESAVIINTGRGDLVDEEALAEALNSGRIKAAGLDVLSKEPPLPDNPLISARNCYITPHISWATVEARERLIGISVDNLEAFLAGKPINVVS